MSNQPPWPPGRPGDGGRIAVCLLLGAVLAAVLKACGVW